MQYISRLRLLSLYDYLVVLTLIVFLIGFNLDFSIQIFLTFAYYEDWEYKNESNKVWYVRSYCSDDKREQIVSIFRCTCFMTVLIPKVSSLLNLLSCLYLVIFSCSGNWWGYGILLHFDSWLAKPRS